MGFLRNCYAAVCLASLTLFYLIASIAIGMYYLIRDSFIKGDKK